MTPQIKTTVYFFPFFVINLSADIFFTYKQIFKKTHTQTFHRQTDRQLLTQNNGKTRAGGKKGKEEDDKVEDGEEKHYVPYYL